MDGKETDNYVKRSSLYMCASLAAVIAVTGPIAGSAAAATASKPAPKTSKTAKASKTGKKVASKDACASKPSKWQRMQCEEYTRSAPGDEYFGRMKLSYLGINNTFHDETIRAGDYTTDPGIIAKAGWADEALRAWQKKYPNDPQLARTYFLAIAMYKKIYTADAQSKAWTYMHVLISKFPATYFGKIEKADLARGFTEHYFANPQMCPTPLPSGVKAPPSQAPSATPTPAPSPGSPKIDIITPPCIQPSLEPSPIPSVSPSSSPRHI